MPPFEQISISFIDKRDKALDQALSEFSAETLPNLKRKDYEMDEEKPCKEVSPQNVEGCKRFRSIRDQSFEKLRARQKIIFTMSRHVQFYCCECENSICIIINCQIYFLIGPNEWNLHY